MIQNILIQLQQYILLYNKYFSDSYVDVSMQALTGYIMSGQLPVFPNDTLGNYFYIRTPNYTKFSYDKTNIQQEGINPIGIEIPCVLIACVRSADPNILLENLITTISAYLPDNIKLINCTTQQDIVIAQEMAKMPVSEQTATMAKVDLDYAMVSISFVITSPYRIKHLNCIKSPTI